MMYTAYTKETQIDQSRLVQTMSEISDGKSIDNNGNNRHQSAQPLPEFALLSLGRNIE
jgi:hypothetical protein